ncbi:EAL domain-containing protein [Vibrio sp. ZSDZ34]|uniref:EAL domain-containing protein n=1 Tax=Vibrio gelatinilyticus TaxID=2893468 RepID=A0A9X1WCG3_9VIBR|nr:EAL domain-containing protein [Vibrio gelatinilyticus]MCJ2376865.1 EAL domain-containing protein [Vibrio gelatinilyticus]
MKIRISHILILFWIIVLISISAAVTTWHRQSQLHHLERKVDSLAISLSQNINRLNLIAIEFNKSRDKALVDKWASSTSLLKLNYQRLANTLAKNNKNDFKRISIDIQRIQQQFEMLQKASNRSDIGWVTLNLTTYTQNLMTHIVNITDQSREKIHADIELLHKAENLAYITAIILTISLLAFLYYSLVNPLHSIYSQLRSINLGRYKNLIKPRIKEWQDLTDEVETLHNRLKNTVVSKDELVAEVELRKQAENNALILSQQDSLTGLPNRRHFMQLLHNSMSENGKLFYLFFLDLDNLKGVNDNLGHTTGDHIIIHVSKVLKENIKGDSIIVRLGGDEFAIIHFSENETEALELAKRIRHHIGQPIDIDDIQLRVTCSVGIAHYPEHGSDIKQLLSHSDTAMYFAKHNPVKTGGVAVYHRALGDLSHNHFTLVHALKKAIADKEFEVWFQPQIIVDNGHIHGFEALLRWKKASGEFVSPDSFIPILEESGDIVELGKFVFEQAFSFYQQLIAKNMNYKVSINVSAIQLERSDFVDYLCKEIDKLELSARNFPIELTETAIIHNESQILYSLRRLQKKGFQIQLDDFGTGNASLNTLKKLRFDVVKIDKSFTQESTKFGRDLPIIKAIVAMSKALNFEIVIEGVETEHQHLLAQNCSIAFAQGYHYAKPMPVGTLLNWLAQRRTAEEKIEANISTK